MQRRILISIILLCLIGISVFLVIFLRNNESVPNNSMRAIPVDAALVVQINNLSEASEYFTAKNEVWNGISQLQILKNGCEILTKIDSVVSTNDAYVPFKTNELLFAVKQIGKNKLDFLFIMPLQNKQDVDVVKSLVEDAFTVNNSTSYTFNKTTVFSYVDNSSDRKNLSYAVCQNTVIISESKVSVESAIKGLTEGKNLESDADFQKVRPNASKVPVRVFFHYDKMVTIFELFASEDYKSLAQKFPKIGSWTELDLSYTAKSLRFNGYVTTDSEKATAEYMNLFNGQKALRGEVFSVIPSSVTNFIAMNVSDKEKYRQNYEAYLTQNSYYNSYSSTLKELTMTFVNDFYSQVNEELAFVMLPSYTENPFQNTYAVIKVLNVKQMEEILKARLADCTKQSIKIDEPVVYTAAGNENFTIYKLPLEPLGRIPQKIWGNLFSHMNARYVTFVGSYMVFSNSAESAQIFIDDNAKGKVLSSDPNYARFDDNVKTSYSLYAYASIPYSISLFKDFFGEEPASIIERNSNALKNMDALSYQLVADGSDKLYNDIYISLNSVKSEVPEVEWKCLLDTTLLTNPTIFMSHRDEILTLAQDVKNSLYLIDNNTNKILWKKQLDGQIMGKIYFVDALRNNKMQYLFNTSSSIYLLDRNGESVGNFPIRMESPATAEIAVFDYDNVKKYRIAVPCQDHTIRLFSLEMGLSASLSDWNQLHTESDVKGPLQHFTDQKKDYIVFADQYHVYVINRKGETRIAINEILEKAPNASIAFESGAETSLSRFITTDVDGILKEIYLDGHVVSSETYGKRSAQHYFIADDIDEDGNLDYIFIDENKIDAYSHTAKKMFSYSTDETLTNPIVKDIGNGKKICVSESKNGKVYVVNPDGSLYKGFPIDGKSYYDLFGDSKVEKGFNLIVGGERNLLYNYTIK